MIFRQLHQTVFLFSILLLVTCADRDRSNPLDPRNPDTGGEPSGLRITASRDTVNLRWDRIALTDVIGVRLDRKPENQTDFVELALLPPNTSRFEDTTVEFGIEYSYRITAVGDDFESMPSDEVTIEPGPTFNWVAENPTRGSRRLLKFTHDARHVLQSTSGFLTIIDLESNPKTGEVWALDFVTAVLAQIIRVSPTGRVENPIINLKGPRDLAIDINTGAIWIADVRDSVLLKFDALGEELFRLSDFEVPAVVGVNQRTGDCWVGDKGTKKVVKVSPDGLQRLTSSQQFDSVEWLSVNSGDGSIWVSTGSQIVKLTENGELSLALAESFTFARRIAVNDNNGDVWVMNWDPSTISKFTGDGQKAFELSGFARPEDIAVNLFDNSCLVSDTENDRVVKVDSLGEASVVQEISFPGPVAIQNEFR